MTREPPHPIRLSDTMTILKRLFVIIALLLFITPRTHAQIDNPDTAIWRTADTIRTLSLEAQRELFASRRANDDQGTHNQNAHQLIQQAYDLYLADLQPDIHHYNPQADDELIVAFENALQASLDGDIHTLSRSRGRIWTELLNASYSTTLNAIQAGDFDTAHAWLSFREYRQATRVTIILSPASKALTQLQTGELSLEDGFAIIENDLRDTYYFRLRQAASELQFALDSDYFIRASEWFGQVQGYFSIFADDYQSQMGTTTPQDALITLSDAIKRDSVEDSTHALMQFRDSLIGYQPVDLTPDQIAERGQLLYIFTDLVYIEYKDGVRNGEITIPVEYQEANTFLGQARSTFEELRPTISARNTAGASRLDAILSELQTIIQNIGEVSDVRKLVEEAKGIVSNTLPMNLRNTTSATFTIIQTLFDDMENSIADKRYRDAENTRLQAYALFDFGPEQRLLAFAPDLAFKIDAIFWHGDNDGSGLARVIANKGTVDQFRAVRSRLNSALDEAQIILGTSSQPLTIIVNSAIIVFREGLEAVVIIAALSAGMVRTDTKYRKPLFVGAFGAFIGTAITWVIADAFLSLFRDYGERLEAVVSLIALGVLLVITNWFFHKVYWTDHLAGFHKRKGSLLRGEAGKYLGLMTIGFTSIYREGFETVLFLQALVLDAGVWTVLQGVGLGLIGVVIVGIITFKMQTRLPYMKMMVMTGVLIGAVLIMLVGNTIRVMQVVAWLPIHPIDGVNFPYWWGQWFGVYPTWEGILAQVGAAVFVLGSYYLAEYQSKKAREAKKQQRLAQTN